MPRKKKTLGQQEALASRPPKEAPLDPVIYGLQRMTGECLAYLTPQEKEVFTRIHLPLKPYLTAEDFTPKGQVALLRMRGYTDQWIEEHYPNLKAHL